ncbi:MAG: quinone-dependent dihydroorotate dehydrogenase [Rhodocyclaceae bacterium]|nr:quinone-dependent dihydroorotate dehydrogenase [Rhodocyclaceae bacterium]MCA3023776.1 quinone-dependent dihydroorotate dehydrogenase [Rhodocyclaceae bacterium]MCA3027196.1 quinone-dependent dihydroorotate dehydrogenase [Rhodocyclaceae bacterium]MCA3030609.1 quinone-dependent dihydroorotate dehydrogenase [Rhodocyclaceae bacterium]MCA3035763.1 quinone-dependent dihydroorotate dehydrogenase [Rhodocyclaceae bacterium]
MLYSIARSALFKLDPELAHDVALKSLKRLESCHLAGLFGQKVLKPRTLLGLSFDNAVGLAAGLDKNGEYIDALAAMGFGFIEVGTVTARPQPGNPKPRMFRLPARDALINRLGFNNQGLDAFLVNVARAKYKGVLGLNIGKNFDTPNHNAVDDYVTCLRGVFPHASYVTVNVSSPNTKGLRDLQAAAQLEQLLAALKAEQQTLAKQHRRQVPLLLKIAPDLNLAAIRDVAALLLQYGFEGAIATNTTVSRDAVTGLKHATEAGGLSGRPLFSPSTEVLRELVKHLKGNIPVIGVGGIMSADDAQQKINAGASLVQIYTGFIYRGPQLVADCARQIQ